MNPSIKHPPQARKPQGTKKEQSLPTSPRAPPLPSLSPREEHLGLIIFTHRTGTSVFSKDGSVGKMFNPDGAIGGTAQKIGGPFDKEGSIGSQFKADGKIGGMVQQNLAEKK